VHQSRVAVLRGRWRKLGALSPRERLVLIRALVGLPLMSLRLRLFGLRGLRVPLPPASLEAEPPGDSLSRAQRINRLVEAALHVGFGGYTCLQKSAVLWRLLRREGLEAELRLGVRRVEQASEFHAWVEFDGRVLNDVQSVRERFVPFNGPVLLGRFH
jgi:hypothetical protein